MLIRALEVTTVGRPKNVLSAVLTLEVLISQTQQVTVADKTNMKDRGQHVGSTEYWQQNLKLANTSLLKNITGNAASLYETGLMAIQEIRDRG